VSEWVGLGRLIGRLCDQLTGWSDCGLTRTQTVWMRGQQVVPRDYRKEAICGASTGWWWFQTQHMLIKETSLDRLVDTRICDVRGQIGK